MGRPHLCWAAGMTAIVLAACSGQPPEPSEPKAGYVTGVQSAEDLVGIPDTGWIITSGLAEGDKPGSLFLIDREKKTASNLLPADLVVREDRAAYPGCPGVPDKAVLSAHGIALRKGADGKHGLYVMNHGGREAIEVFEVVASGERPALAWIGCVPLPEGVIGNGVAALPDGGIVVTHMAVPRYFGSAKESQSQEGWVAKFSAGALTGYAAEWTKEGGWKELAGTEGSGPNGIETSSDGQWIWVANWPVREVVRVPTRQGEGEPKREVVKLNFLPDNLRWGDDGWLWVAGAAGTTGDFFACHAKPGCKGDYRVARIDPASLKVELVPHPDTRAAFGDATVALKLGDAVWLGSVGGDKVAYLSQ